MAADLGILEFSFFFPLEDLVFQDFLEKTLRTRKKLIMLLQLLLYFFAIAIAFIVAPPAFSLRLLFNILLFVNGLDLVPVFLANMTKRFRQREERNFNFMVTTVGLMISEML